MKKFLLFAFVLVISLNARENPFFPPEGEKDIPFTSNEQKIVPPLKRATIELPSHARVLESVTISFKNLDGSIQSKSIKLDNSVDWHLPLFISQSYESASTPTAIVKKDVPKKKSVEKNEVDYKEIASMQFAKFYSSQKNLKILTSDKMLRNFLLVQPHRIVLDFKRDSSMKSYIKKIPKNTFTKIRVGNHDGYYRVVIELDGYYRYKIKDIEGGYSLKLL